MSITQDRRHVRCDEPHCQACARVPVGLRSSVARSSNALSGAVDEWLFVARHGRRLHFCPRCAPGVLKVLRAGADPYETAGPPASAAGT